MTAPRWLREHEEKMAKATGGEWSRCEEYAAINTEIPGDGHGHVIIDCDVGGRPEREQRATADAVWSSVNLDPVFVAAARWAEAARVVKLLENEYETQGDPAALHAAHADEQHAADEYDHAKRAAGLEDE